MLCMHMFALRVMTCHIGKLRTRLEADYPSEPRPAESPGSLLVLLEVMFPTTQPSKERMRCSKRI